MVDIHSFLYPAVDDVLGMEVPCWEKAVVKIEGVGNYVGTDIQFFSADGMCISRNEKDLTPSAKISLIQMHKVMEQATNIFEKWNRADLVIKKGGSFEINFHWDQALQDTWDAFAGT